MRDRRYVLLLVAVLGLGLLLAGWGLLQQQGLLREAGRQLQEQRAEAVDLAETLRQNEVDIAALENQVRSLGGEPSPRPTTPSTPPPVGRPGRPNDGSALYPEVAPEPQEPAVARA